MKAKAKKRNIVVRTCKQRACGVFALVMVFVCGLMLGIGGQKCVVKLSARLQSAQGANAEQSQPKETCRVIEEIQLGWLKDENSPHYEAHESNVRIYETLFQHGCPENKVQYRDAIAREMEIIASLKEEVGSSTCQQIEASLINRLPEGNVYTDSDDRIYRAKIYANLSERGCPENKAKYVELAKQELEIARALEDDEFEEDETIEVVETYKRLNMQAAAQEFLDTLKGFVDPTVNFILEIEKIVNK